MNEADAVKSGHAGDALFDALDSDKPSAREQLSGLIFATLLIDEDTKIVEANPAAEDLLELSLRKMLDRPLLEILPLTDSRLLDGLANQETRMIARGIDLVTRERELLVNITCSPILKNPGWRIITVSDAGQDIDPNEDSAPLRAPAVLAHEIKNPLAAIRGASQLLERRIDPKHTELTKMIAGETDRIAALIDRMQQLGSQPSADIGPCNLHQAIRNAMATVRTARFDQVELKEEFDPSLPLVMADQSGLEQVLINLLSNACEASAGLEDAQVTVRTRYISGLRFSALKMGKSTRLPIEITVSDKGPGIDKALRDHVFEPFVSGKSSGQGLGLALVRKLVRDMGGRIGHDRDREKKRTNFRVNLAVAGPETKAGSNSATKNDISHQSADDQTAGVREAKDGA